MQCDKYTNTYASFPCWMKNKSKHFYKILTNGDFENF